MKRNHAMAVAATTAMIGVASVVTVAALTGASVFGLHFGGTSAPVALAEVPETTTEAPTSQPPTTDTLPPAVVVQTEYVDQYVTLTVAPAAPVAYQPAAAAPEPEPAYEPPATQATAPPTAATTAATAPPATDPATTAATAPPTTQPATTQPTAATTTTLFDRSKYPFKVDIPGDWGSKPVPALPTPAAGKQWQECELHSWGWACQYP